MEEASPNRFITEDAINRHYQRDKSLVEESRAWVTGSTGRGGCGGKEDRVVSGDRTDPYTDFCGHNTHLSGN